jgi:hypothetical protein
MMIVGVLVTLFAVRMGHITLQWHEADRKYDEYIAAIDQLPEGARLFSVVAYANSRDPFPTPRDPFPTPVDQLACWAVLKKSAFVSNIFAFPSVQPITLTPPYRRLFTSDSVFYRSAVVPWDRIGKEYEYLLVVREQFLQYPLPPTFLQVFTGKDFQLYRLPGHQ